MSTSTSVTELKINKLTKAQYNSIVTPSNTELYFVKDEAIDYEDLINTPDFAEVAFSGDYYDLTNRPVIPAAQVNADWNASFGISQILNKPELSTVATTGNYNDLIGKPSITNTIVSGSASLLTSGGAYSNLVSNVVAGSTANKINVTKAGTTSTITIDNVANATTATKLGSTSVGTSARPIYLNNGVPTQISYTIQKSVPSDAKFTDTTYSEFTGASSSADGTAGLVKKPVAGDQNKFLKGDGSWSLVDSFPSQSGNAGKYLTTNGSTVSWDALADVANSGDYDDLTNKPVFNGIELDNTNKSFYGTSDTAAATTEKYVSIPSITTLEAGQIIIVQPSITSTVASSTLKLNDFDAYPMLYGNAAITTSTDSIVWNASFPSIWLFNGTNWVFLAHGTDTNTTYTTLNQTHNAGIYKSGSGSYAITRYSLIAEKPNGTWEKITATNATYSTSTSKAVNTSGFVLGQIKYYATTTTLANGALSAANVVYEKYASVDMRYSTNCGATPGWSNGEYIYLVGTIGADSLFYLDTTTWWTNTLPSTNDGKVYVQIGHVATANAAYATTLDEDHPVFYHDGTRIRQYNPADNKLDKSNSPSELYATDSLGGQTLLSYDTSNSVNSIAQRDSNSQISVAQTPTANTHAASKKYVDDTVAADYAMQIIDWTA